MADDAATIDGHRLELSHTDKVLFPDDGITKGDLIDYYKEMAPHMLPHLAGRPVSMQRFPDGIGKQGFYQKKLGGHFPDWISRATVEVKEQDRKQEQVVADSAADLVYLANQACITIHPWLSREKHIEKPDRIIFDLDPPGKDFGPVKRAARKIEEALREAGLVPFVMTTGSKGLHVTAPIKPEKDFDEVREFASSLAERLAKDNSDEFTVETLKKERKGRVFLDYLRNAYGQTGVAPYSVRPLPGAPVAAPLDWDELSSSGLHPRKYHIGNIKRRLSQKEDPWKDMERHKRSIKE